MVLSEGVAFRDEKRKRYLYEFTTTEATTFLYITDIDLDRHQAGFQGRFVGEVIRALQIHKRGEVA